ncbi:hypothetical protein R3P38DRAFT_3055623 [Favolaschia claudopus]|uniref:Uncharacterized protein n=1 Tax=Favolaschia claudopus TaxID=2862362 RepID=A0AAW0A571_9AGAR
MSISPYEESIQEIYLRALLERNPYPFIDFIFAQLKRKPLFDLWKMNEAVFQAIIDCSMEDHSRDGIKGMDPELVGSCGRYCQNYFPQLGLCTNPVNSDQPDQSTPAPQTHKATTSSGSKQKSSKAVALPKQPAGQGESSGSKQNSSKAVALPKQPSGQGEHGYVDCVIAGLRRLREARFMIIELKYISPHQLVRIGYPLDSHTEYNDAVRTQGFRYLSLLAMEKTQSRSIGKLKKTEYCYYDSDKKQLVRSTIGQAAKGSKTRGITRTDGRITVSKCTEAEPADELIGYILLGIGRSIIPIEVESQVQNTSYTYRGTPGWMESYEQRSLNYKHSYSKE